MRYPPANTWKKSMSRPAPSGHRAKRLGDCSQCGKAFAISKLQVDHVIPAGALQNAEDIGPFILRLFTTSDNIRLVCHQCHAIITKMERFQCSEAEAQIHSKVIAFTKLKPSEQTAILTRHECPPEHTRNGAVRRRAIHAWFTHQSFEGLPYPPAGQGENVG